MGTSSPQSSPAPYQLLDDGFAPPACDVLVIGCGNILRGDDAVGPALVRTLYAQGVPDSVRLIDGGTAGMDVAFAMRGAARVVLVDAAATGAEPGTVYRVPATELVDPPPAESVHSHNFRWDHALSLADWLLGPDRPTDVTVFLIEVGGCTPGDPLTPAVDAAMHGLAELLATEFWSAPPDPADAPHVTLTADGYLHLDRDVARRWFPADVAVARLVPGAAVHPDVLELIPLQGIANGGLVLRQRNAAADRTVLIHEVLGFTDRSGTYPLVWDDAAGLVRVTLDRTRPPDGGLLDPDREAIDGRGRDNGGGRGERPVGGLSPGGDRGRGGTAPIDGVSHSADGRDRGEHDPADHRATQGAREVTR
ncbi:hypothetical protein GCM10023147_36600 [Tsukamurella soli]|uniref:Hydrogenase maturation protease n=1 Tax=Tsukamurella soli TaxID=644556 RepID=A0ABP8K1Z7_9ACTN